MQNINTKQRNHNILRLRGMLPCIARLVPEDIRLEMTSEQFMRFQNTAKHILNLLDNAAERNARTRIKKTKSLTKQAKRDLLTIYKCWDMTDYEYKCAYENVNNN